MFIDVLGGCRSGRMFVDDKIYIIFEERSQFHQDVRCWLLASDGSRSKHSDLEMRDERYCGCPRLNKRPCCVVILADFVLGLRHATFA